MREVLLHERLADPSRAAVVSGGVPVSWGELARLAATCARLLARLRGARVGVRISGSAGCWAVLAALDALGAEAVLLDAALGRDGCVALAAEHALSAIVSAGEADGRALAVHELAAGAPARLPRAVTILTSGTTGRPKAVRHRWEGLARPVRRGGAPRTWLLAYRPDLYAGLQVALQALADQGTLVVPRRGASPAELARLMADHRVDSASATPSWWRRLLILADPEDLRRVPLRQVTLGGELVDQQVLDALARRFPAARIVHVYATTELGRCFSVADGRAGFPAAWLDAVPEDGVELRVEGGELLVRSANEMEGYAAPVADRAFTGGGLFATGDLVEVRGDRVRFVGRRSDLINVGGNKVHPAEVERLLRAVPGLGDVRVYARRSSIAGELVACDVVPAPGADGEALRAEIARRCAAGLLAHQRPRLVQLVGEIAVSAAGKVRRREGP